MNPEDSFQKNIKELGWKEKHIDEGVDSEVFLISGNDIEVMAKKYHLYEYMPDLNHAQIQEIIKRYARDTERARELCEKSPNPFEQLIEFGNGDNYEPEFIIFPQGGLILEDKSTKGIGEEVQNISFGQKFIPGLNLRELESLSYNSQINAPENQNFLMGEDKYNKLFLVCLVFFSKLSEKLNAPFNISGLNIKPFLDKDTKKIKIIITDLCGSLGRYFEMIEK